MRLFFFLVVFANLLLFVWTRGYFGANDNGHEPQRLAQQFNAEKLRIVREAQTPPARKNEMACRFINGLAVADAEALKATIEGAGAAASISPVAEPTLYLVVIADLVNKAAAEKKLAELARLGLKGFSAVSPNGERLEVILDSFDSEAAALEFLQAIAKRGVRSARLDSRERPALKVRVEIRAPASVLLELPKLIAPYPDAIIGECVA